MANKLVSIITPSYNSAKFIKQTADSVLAQSYKDWEMLIVDDCSTDNSVKIINQIINQDERIKLIQLNKNSGQAIARNTAIKQATGRYIAFLDADDLWLPEKLEQQIQFMADNNLGFTYCSYNIIDEKNNSLGVFITKSQITYTTMLKTCDVGCLTAIYDTDILGKVYMDNVVKREDYGLWLKILKMSVPVKGMLEVLATYRIHKNSVSSNKIIVSKYQWKIYRDIESLGLFRSIYYFIQYAYYGIIKYRACRSQSKKQ